MTTPVEKFILLSVQLCGISQFDLMGTGYANSYLVKVESIVGASTFNRLLDTFASLPVEPFECQDHLQSAILDHPEFGPVARNIIKLWYTATWFKLPDSWRQEYGERPEDRDFIPFPYAYTESLLGPAVGAHPAGAKPTGHQSWALPPKYLDIPPECI